MIPDRSARGRAAAPVADPVGDVPGARAVGFRKADHPNCSAILFDNLARDPGALAVTGPAGTRTYAELCAEAAAWGRAFRAAGLERGERIAFVLDDTPAFPAAFFGAVRAGFVPVLLNTQTGRDLLTFFVEDSGAPLALCDAAFAPLFRAGDVRTLVVANGEGPSWSLSAAAFLAGHAGDLPMADTGPDDMAFWMYSSGSTGRPKGIVHLHHDMAYTAATYSEHVLGVRPGDRLFSAPKLFFAYGFGNGITFPFAAGASAVLMPGQPRAAAVLDAIERFRPTMLFGLPTLYTGLCRAPDASARDLSSLRLTLSAAETLSEDVARAWRDLSGCEAVEGLGSTEMLHIYLSNRPGDARPGSVGAPVPGYEVKLCDADGAEVPAGAEGVMWVRGHSSAPLYWNRPDKTAETMRGDWIHTSDRFVARGGAFYFQGRADDLVKVSGQWVWPLEVERCLAEHPHVHECAVLADRLPDRRTALRAVVRLRGGHAADAEQTRALRDFVKGRLLPFKAPRSIEYVDALPHTGTGKIDRRALASAGAGATSEGAP